MAHTLSARKRVRRTQSRTLRNKSIRSQYKTYTTKALKALEGDDVEAAEQAVKQALRLLDKTVRKGILHRNSAARRKSRLARKLNKARAASATE